MTDEQTRQPVLRKLYLAPSYSNSEGLVAESLSVLAEILGGGPTSRLYRELIVEQKLAAQAAAWYSGAAIGQGSFGFSLVPRPGVDPAKLEEAFETVLQEFLAGGATDTEVTRAKSNLLAQAIYARDSQGNMARIYGVSLTTGETVEDVVAWPKRMRALQTKDVTAAANFIFQTQGGVTGLLLPVSSSAAQGRKLPAGKERTP
jgi:zinc protease